MTAPKGILVDTPEAYIASANTPWAIMNAAFLPKPVETVAELDRSLTTAARHLASNPAGWLYVACDDWLPANVKAEAPALFAAHGMGRAMNAQGMVADSLVPPLRPLPLLEVHRATEVEALRHIADINAHAYASPVEIARQAVVHPAIFANECRGYVGSVEGRAVSVAAVTHVDGIAYVGLVATLAEYRRRGYAEAVMRHALEMARKDWGIERTVLHATDAGHPVYLRMGYRDTTNFGMYLPLPPAK